MNTIVTAGFDRYPYLSNRGSEFEANMALEPVAHDWKTPSKCQRSITAPTNGMVPLLAAIRTWFTK